MRLKMMKLRDCSIATLSLQNVSRKEVSFMYSAKIPVGVDVMIEDLSHEEKITQDVKNFYEKIQFPGHRPVEQDSLIFLRKFSAKDIKKLMRKNLIFLRKVLRKFFRR